MTDKVQPTHRRRDAYVYVRQSSPGQLERNTESTRRQYALVDRALELGWRNDQVRVIDELVVGLLAGLSRVPAGALDIPSRSR